MSKAVLRDYSARMGTSRTDKEVRFHVERYDNAEEIADNSKSRPYSCDRFRMEQTSRHLTKERHGVSSYEEALTLLRSGYQPAVDEVKRIMKPNLAGQKKRYTFEQSVAGFAPIVPLALMGVPNSMISARVVPIKTKVIDIYFDMTVSWHTDTDKIFRSGAKMIAALLELEMQGYRFNLYAVQGYYEGDACDMLICKVKSASLGLDIKRMSFPLMHPAFFRCMGFDWYSKVPNGKYRDGYGTALAYQFNQEQITAAFRQMFGQSTVFFASKEIISKDTAYIQEVITGKRVNEG